MTNDDIKELYDKAEEFHDTNFEKLVRYLDDAGNAESIIEAYKTLVSEFYESELQLFKMQAKINVILSCVVKLIGDES